MKRTGLVVLFLFIFMFATLTNVFAASAPSIVGTWEFTGEEGYKEIYSFTQDGYFVNEIHSEDWDDYYFGEYTFDGKEVDLGYTSYDVVLEKKALTLDDMTFKRTANKAANNTSRIAGVWENDYYTIGFTRDGLAISMGYYANIDHYKTDNGTILIDGEESEYIIIGNNLYIDGFDFIDEYYPVKFTRKTSTGTNTFNKSVLTQNSVWTFGSSDIYDPATTELSFTSGGKYTGKRTFSSGVTSSLSGTYTIEGSEIRLSSGDFVAIAIIDDIPIGYIIY